MEITTPKLPPRAGYVEDVDADGSHYYRAVRSTARTDLLTQQVTTQADSVADLAETVADIIYQMDTKNLGGTEK